MHIQLAITAPNGAVLSYHRVAYIQVYPDSATAIVRSYTAPDQPLIGWEQPLDIPLTALSSDPIRSVAQALIADGGYLPGGSIVEDE